MGRDSGWKPQRRDGGGTSWGDAWHFHKRTCCSPRDHRGDHLVPLARAARVGLAGAPRPASVGAVVARQRQRTASAGRSRGSRCCARPRKSSGRRWCMRRAGADRRGAEPLPEDGLRASGAQSRGAPGARRRQPAAPRRSARASRIRTPSPREQKLIDARSLEEALEWLTPRRARPGGRRRGACSTSSRCCRMRSDPPMSSEGTQQ